MKKINIFYFVLKTLVFVACGLQLGLCIKGVSSWCKLILPASNCAVVLILDKMDHDLKKTSKF